MNDLRLFLKAEQIAHEFNLFPTADPGSEFSVQGLLSSLEIQEILEELQDLDVNSYIERVVTPAELNTRTCASDVVHLLGKVTQATSNGPYLDAILEMDFPEDRRLVAVLAQDRAHRNGVWGPEEHFAAAEFVQSAARRSIPIVSLMDTPGAAADELANRGNQAHNISRLIAVMSDVDVPNLGVIFGIGYSGGAIPLAASNMILSVRDGLFSTIQPRGLANIARRHNLAWQECAKLVGVSPFELVHQGNIDGVIDYTPGEKGEKFENFRQAIVTGISSIEASTKTFVSQESMFLEEYRYVLNRYLNPTERMKQTESASLFEFVENPTDYLNVFGLAYRFSRFLRVRRRIKSTSTNQYGRLAHRDLPKGELKRRMDIETRRTFLRWLQDPDRIVYDDALKGAWRNYLSRKASLGESRNRLQRVLFGEPVQNFENAKNNLLGIVGSHLVNRWKNDSSGNLSLLLDYLRNDATRFDFVHPMELINPKALIQDIGTDQELGPELRDRLTYQGSQLQRTLESDTDSDEQLAQNIALELNLAITGEPFATTTTNLPVAVTPEDDRGEIRAHNRRLVELSFAKHLRGRSVGFTIVDEEEVHTILDIIQQPDLKPLFIKELQNHRILDIVYNRVISSLDTISYEAKNTQSLEPFTLRNLLLTHSKAAIEETMQRELDRGIPIEELQERFFVWYLRFSTLPSFRKFLLTVEDWKKSNHAQISDTLFVVITFLFEKLVVSYLKYESEGTRYNGKITPRNIGRRRDFWNRLHNAYRDLQIQEVLSRYKKEQPTTYHNFRDKFFEDFEELYGDLLSSDPCEFPGFRLSVEAALDKKLPPCGIVTGMGTFKGIEGGFRFGVIISNSRFQAGAFDMASAEKFCRLLHACAEQRLPLICFISSGGMQTKEGAGALFSMAAINDRITHFVRDYDLPVIVFGYGDCTGGAQASFVTHPLVHTYYLSGTSMPFAGQIVVPSYLPLDSILSNYLVSVPGSMQGLVKHPFYENLDKELREIDDEIPLPEVSVTHVVAGVMAGALSAVRSAQLPKPERKVSEVDLYSPVKRVLVHTRGCAALKIVRIARKNELQVVLVQSDPDMESAAVDALGENDEVVCIGGNTPDESYLNARSVLTVAEQFQVDSLHPGIGFLSESSQFAELIRVHGINFIGPPVSAMETMGNKSNAINTALKLGVPVVPGSHGIVADVERATALVGNIGFPLLIKAVHGGGGKGIQLVESMEEFSELFQRVSVEARAAFGSGDVYLERYVTQLRHIEVQILRDRLGNVKVLGIRDCSVQRNRQKVFEESASTMLPSKLEKAVYDYSASLANEVGYVGAGTVEFIFDIETTEVYFMEMNTRLQVEHPVTEVVSGVDIVSAQFAIASGESIEDKKVARKGYAIEARINAEYLVRNATGELAFQPSAGAITECVFPDDPKVDLISIAATGKFISPYYDSMIAQVIAQGSSRNAAADRLYKYLDGVTIKGIGTNIALLKRILQDEIFRKGIYTTGYLPEFLERTDGDSLIAEMEAMKGVGDSTVDLESIRIESSTEIKVLSPTTGIFYSKPTPAEPDYVRAGEVIDVNRILCQIEAFKVFTPMRLRDLNTGSEDLYPSTNEYEVIRVNVDTGQQVNFGDLLLVIKPVR